MTEEERLLYFADHVLDMAQNPWSKAFDGFFPLADGLYGDDDYGIFMDATPDALDSPASVAVYTDGTNGKPEQISSLRCLSRKQLRKRTGLFAMHPYELQAWFGGKHSLGKTNRKQQTAYLDYTRDGFRWLDVPGYESPPIAKAESIDTAQVLLGVQFNLENQDYVYLKRDEDTIGFKLPLTSSQDLKNFFKLRDIEDGKQRRTALRHLVASHCRSKPGKPDEKIQIREYLRGAETFKWFGISGYIHTVK